MDIVLEIGIILIVLAIIVWVVQLSSGAMNRRGKGVIGTITSINGTLITLKSKMAANGEATAYTIDASNAVITKNNNGSNMLGLAVGDTIVAQGNISSIHFTAKTIVDKMPQVKAPSPRETEIF